MLVTDGWLCAAQPPPCCPDVSHGLVELVAAALGPVIDSGESDSCAWHQLLRLRLPPCTHAASSFYRLAGDWAPTRLWRCDKAWGTHTECPVGCCGISWLSRCLDQSGVGRALGYSAAPSSDRRWGRGMKWGSGDSAQRTMIHILASSYRMPSVHKSADIRTHGWSVC